MREALGLRHTVWTFFCSASLRVKRVAYHISCVRVETACLKQSAFSLSRSFIQPEQFSCGLFFLSVHRKAVPRCCFLSWAFLLAHGVEQPFSFTLSSYVVNLSVLGCVWVDILLVTRAVCKKLPFPIMIIMWMNTIRIKWWNMISTKATLSVCSLTLLLLLCPEWHNRAVPPCSALPGWWSSSNLPWRKGPVCWHRAQIWSSAVILVGQAEPSRGPARLRHQVGITVRPLPTRGTMASVLQHLTL